MLLLIYVFRIFDCPLIIVYQSVNQNTMKKILLGFIIICLHSLATSGQNCNLNCPKNLSTSLHPEFGCTRALSPYDLMTNPSDISPTCQAYQLKLDYPYGTHQMNTDGALDISHSGYSMTYHIIDSVSKNSCWGTLKVNSCDLCQIPTPPVITSFTVTPEPIIPGTTINLSVTAMDNISISKVEFYNGTSLFKTDYSAPYSTTYTTHAEYASKNYFKAIVYDNCGDKDTSDVLVRTTLFPTCYDGVKNGSETGVDCGGGCHDICPVACYKPSGLTASVSGSYVTLSWYGTVTQYDLEIFNISTSTLVVTIPIATNPYHINLVDGNYKYRVRQGSSCLWSDYVSFSVNTYYGHCYVPTNLAHTINGSQVNLSWTGYASQYHLEIINTTTHATVVTSLISTTNYQISLPNGYYKWRVKSVCGSQYSDWCTDQIFAVNYTDPHCYAPSYLTSSVSGDKVTLTWSGSAADYHLEIINVNTYATVVSATWASSPYQATLPNGTYKAKVRTVCGSGYSSWTSEVIFTINYASHPPCAKPYHMLFSINGTYATISWSGDGSQYQIELENTDKNVMVNNDIMAGTIFQSTLAPGNYRCRVKSKCPPDWSDWCDYGWFTIQGDHPIPGPGSPPSTCAAPTQLFPSVALHDVTLSWSGSADQYQLQAENRVTGEAVISAGLNTKSYLATLPNGGYHYRVRSQCGNDYSEWSSWSEFTVNAASPVVTTPEPDTCHRVPTGLSAMVVGHAVTLTWAGGTAQYMLQLNNTNAATNLIEEVLLDKTYSTTLTEGVYEFKVQGVCGTQQTSWSQTAIVVIGGSDDEAIGHYAPVDSSCTNSISPRIIQATKNSVTLKWNKGSGAANYTIEVIDVAHPEVYRYITTQYTDTTITITGLLPNNVYNIFVKTICGTGVSQRTSHTIVTTPATNSTATSKFDCDAPPGLAVNFISATSALVSWGPVTGLKYYKLVAESTGDTPAFSLLQTVLNNQFTVTNLAPGGSYQFKVGAECFFSKSVYTPNMAFTMPDAPSALFSLEARSAPIHPMTVEVFPNPVRSTLNIKLHDNVDHQGWLELTNINGQIQSTWKNIPLHESMSLNVEQLSSGVYFLRINTGRNQIVKKIVVE